MEELSCPSVGWPAVIVEVVFAAAWVAKSAPGMTMEKMLVPAEATFESTTDAVE